MEEKVKKLLENLACAAEESTGLEGLMKLAHSLGLRDRHSKISIQKSNHLEWTNPGDETIYSIKRSKKRIEYLEKNRTKKDRRYSVRMY